MKQTNQDPFFEVLDRRTFFDYRDIMKECINYHTIVREDNFEVFSIPKRSWKLITYLESVEKADILAKSLFEKKSLLDSSLKFNYTYNGTGGAQCFMKIWDEYFFNDPINNTDVWLPVVCISNNYDGSGALHYDFGFQIKGYNSNIIFEDFNINLKVNHNKSGKDNITKNLIEKLDKINFESKSKFIKKFIKKIKKIVDKGLGKSEVFPLVLKFLEADVKVNSRQKTKDAYLAIKREIDDIFLFCDKLDVYTFMKEMSIFIDNTRTLSEIKDNGEDDEEEEIEEINNSGNNNPPLSLKTKIKMQKKLGNFIDRIIKEAIEHKDEDGEFDPILIKDWIGKKYFDMVGYLSMPSKK